MLKAISSSVSATFRIEVINNAPVVNIALPGLAFAPGFVSSTVDVSKTFKDPDGDAMTYTVESNATDILTAAIAGTTVSLTGKALGTAIIRRPEGVFGFTTENTGADGLIESWVRSIHVERNDDLAHGCDWSHMA